MFANCCSKRNFIAAALPVVSLLLVISCLNYSNTNGHHARAEDVPSDATGNAPTERPAVHVQLPEIPEKRDEIKPQLLLDLAGENLGVGTDALKIELLSHPSKEGKFVLAQVDKVKPRWKIKYQSEEANKTIAQIALRNQQVHFAWDKKNANNAIGVQLQNTAFKLGLPQGDRFMHMREPIISGHHGYNVFHKTPDKIRHRHTIPDIPADDTIYLRVRHVDPNSPLGKLPEKQRTEEFRDWIDLKWKINKFLSIIMEWRVAPPSKKDQVPNGPNLEVHQKLTYKIPRAKGLPLNKIQINDHRGKIKQQIAQDKNMYENYQQQLQKLRARANAIAGAQRGTREFAEQTVVRNKIKSVIGRMESINRRTSNNYRDLKILEPLEKVIAELKKSPPIPYQVTSSVSGHSIPLVQSHSWHFTLDDCLPLVGQWVNDQGWQMTVTKDSVTTLNPAAANPAPFTLAVQYYEYFGPCSNDSKGIKLWEETKATKILLFFGGEESYLRREFTIADDFPDIAHEDFFARVKDPWSTNKQRLRGWYRAEKFTWTRVK